MQLWSVSRKQDHVRAAGVRFVNLEIDPRLQLVEEPAFEILIALLFLVRPEAGSNGSVGSVRDAPHDRGSQLAVKSGAVGECRDVLADRLRVCVIALAFAPLCFRG